MLANPWLIMGVVLSMACVLMGVLWVVQGHRRDASLVDAGWSFGIGMSGLLVLAFGGGDPRRRLLVGILLSVWSGRLTWYLIRDRLVGKPEDGRYQMLRSAWGTKANALFFLFFQAQALLVVLFTLPFLAFAHDHRPLGTLADGIGAVLWLGAFVGVAWSDRVLAHWRGQSAHRGQTCRAGPWRYSRHPNYFCEWLLWSSYVLLGLTASWWWLIVPIPVLLLILLLYVTGIPYTEARALQTRGEDYRRYQAATSAFIPWFPKRDRDPIS